MLWYTKYYHFTLYGGVLSLKVAMDSGLFFLSKMDSTQRFSLCLEIRSTVGFRVIWFRQFKTMALPDESKIALPSQLQAENHPFQIHCHFGQQWLFKAPLHSKQLDHLHLTHV